ncbi:hypothetical protein [Nocardia sp. NPDC049707]
MGWWTPLDAAVAGPASALVIHFFIHCTAFVHLVPCISVTPCSLSR